MQFKELSIPGVWLIAPDKISDNRGFFARSWSRRELEAQGLVSEVVQTNISFNSAAGTLRGMHYQKAPYEEVKFVRCTRGAIFDVVVDIRPESTSYLQWTHVELSANNHLTLYIPAGFAHGYLTLTDDTELAYMHSEYYHRDSAHGFRWDDPNINIDWPIEPHEIIISDKDRNWSLVSEL